MKIFICLMLICQTLNFFAQDIPAYRLYDNAGKPVTFSDVVASASAADIVFFGELHNDPIIHWLQFELTKQLFEKKSENLILGAEMFESDNQLILDEYLKGLIPAKKFGEEARLWPNYNTDYKPLVDFAQKNKLQFVAANIPRRYASLVANGGFEELNNLSAEAKGLIAPLPVAYDENLNCYKSMLGMGGMGKMSANSNFPKAQAIKDATMAHFIMKYWTKGKTFIQYNGSFHSDNHEGIVWYVKQKNKDIKIIVIASVSQPDVTVLTDENKGRGDYILCVPENMTKTH